MTKKQKTSSGYQMAMTYMTPELYQAGKERAKELGISFCALVRQLLTKEIKKAASCTGKN